MSRLRNRQPSSKSNTSKRQESTRFSSTSNQNKCLCFVPTQPFCHDIGTSTTVQRLEEPDLPAIPVQTITFQLTPSSQQKRNRKVLIVKNMTRVNSRYKYNHSLLSFFDIPSSQDSAKPKPRTVWKSESRRQSFPEAELENPPRRLFDASEILAIAQGQISISKQKIKRYLN